MMEHIEYLLTIALGVGFLIWAAREKMMDDTWRRDRKIREHEARNRR